MIHSESTYPVIVLMRKCWYVEEMETCTSSSATAIEVICICAHAYIICSKNIMVAIGIPHCYCLDK